MFKFLFVNTVGRHWCHGLYIQGPEKPGQVESKGLRFLLCNIRSGDSNSNDWSGNFRARLVRPFVPKKTCFPLTLTRSMNKWFSEVPVLCIFSKNKVTAISPVKTLDSSPFFAKKVPTLQYCRVATNQLDSGAVIVNLIV